jgi:N-acetylmuramoyl-L-alanine amidase
MILPFAVADRARLFSRRRMPLRGFHALLAALLASAIGLASIASAAGTLRIREVEYGSVAAWAAGVGLSVSWTVPGRKLLLRGGGTTIEMEADSREIRLNGLRVFLGEPVLRQGQDLYVSTIDRLSLLEPVHKPGFRQAAVPALRTIAIDPGHGGPDPGTRHARFNLAEKDLALDTAKRLERLLRAAGYRVIMTRNDDSLPSLAARAAAASAAGADLFISIHFNSVPIDSVSGTETYTMTPQHQRSTGSSQKSAADAVAHRGNRHDHWNAVLGYHMHRQLIGDLKSVDRGLKRARFLVLREVTCPAVLLEAGYLSNDADARKFGTPAHRESLARSIAAAVGAYGKALEEAKSR